MLDPALAARAADVAPAFAPAREPIAIAPLGSGHIHATLRVDFADGGESLVLQSLNEHVFPDVAAVMANLALVTQHLRARARAGGEGGMRVLEPVEAADGTLLARDATGCAWRAFVYLRGTTAFDIVPTHELARRTARAFGAFAAALADLDAGSLAEPIPGFHDFAGRLAQLERAVSADRVGRLAGVAPELARARSLGGELLAALEASGALREPPRAVHNDCKINNLLFDERSQPVCVVDLDTVMPGSLLADFGELVRTATCSAAEDERDLSLVDFDLERFEALAGGFLAGLGGALSAVERAALWLGGPWMAHENAVRFLADHLDGDRYFRPRRPDHNLHRTRAQLHLAEQLWASREAMKRALAKAASR